MAINRYFDEESMRKAAATGRHREIIGGRWEAMGKLQFEFLVAHGLKPESYLIDVGCGSLRAGLLFVDYLQPAHYFGIDLSQALLDAGYEAEIVPAGLGGKLPRDHLFATDRFDISGFGQRFDFGIAQSVFSHLTASYFDLCLTALAPYFKSGGTFFATYFEVDAADYSKPVPHVGGAVSHPDKDPFHYTREQIARAAGGHPSWDMAIIGEWGHPGDQRMIRFDRNDKPAGSV